MIRACFTPGAVMLFKNLVFHRLPAEWALSDVDFAVMAGELANLLKDLTGVLGSESAGSCDWPTQSKVA
jgi:DNA recombination-dependent growth factor C